MYSIHKAKYMQTLRSLYTGKSEMATKSRRDKFADKEWTR